MAHHITLHHLTIRVVSYHMDYDLPPRTPPKSETEQRPMPAE